MSPVARERPSSFGENIDPKGNEAAATPIVLQKFRLVTMRPTPSVSMLENGCC